MNTIRSIRKWFLPWPSVILLAAGFSCWVAYSLIGSTIAADGTLEEPFALILIGWFLLLLGVLVSVLRILGIGFRALWQAGQ